jgi:hypothetical protein
MEIGKIVNLKPSPKPHWPAHSLSLSLFPSLPAHSAFPHPTPAPAQQAAAARAARPPIPGPVRSHAAQPAPVPQPARAHFPTTATWAPCISRTLPTRNAPAIPRPLVAAPAHASAAPSPLARACVSPAAMWPPHVGTLSPRSRVPRAPSLCHCHAWPARQFPRLSRATASRITGRDSRCDLPQARTPRSPATFFKRHPGLPCTAPSPFS